MTTSDEDWLAKLRKIGEYGRSDHTRLCADDHCAYFGEYTPVGSSGKSAWSLGEANQILVNIKIHPSKRGTGLGIFTLAQLGIINPVLTRCTGVLQQLPMRVAGRQGWSDGQMLWAGGAYSVAREQWLLSRGVDAVVRVGAGASPVRAGPRPAFGGTVEASPVTASCFDRQSGCQ